MVNPMEASDKFEPADLKKSPQIGGRRRRRTRRVRSRKVRKTATSAHLKRSRKSRRR